MPESEASDEFNDDVRLVLLFPILPGLLTWLFSFGFRVG